MGTIHKNITPAVLAANQANGAASTGPASDTGKEQSKMNAFKNGKYARRPDPVELLRNDHSEEEEAERDQLRADVVRCYQPPDDFACRQAEELADLQFDLRRLERAKEVMLARERELLALEQRRRALRLKQGGVEARAKEINEGGLASQPDSPGKFCEMLRILEAFVRPGDELDIEDVRIFLRRLYGDSERAWRGIRLTWAVARADKADSDEGSERANRDFEREAKREIEQVREELAICELEQGPLSPAGEAARLLEAMGSRKWAWIRQHEMFLRRSIDRKVRMLIDLRRDARRTEGRGTGRAGPDAGATPASGQGGGGDGTDGPAGGSPLAAAVPTPDSAEAGEASTVMPDSGGPGPGSVDTAEAGETNGQSEISRGAVIPRVSEERRHSGGGARNEGLESASREDQRNPEAAGNKLGRASVAGAPVTAQAKGSNGGGLQFIKEAENQGTKPLSSLISAEPGLSGFRPPFK